MATATATAKKLIIEAQNVGRQEMAIRRTNTGIAGSIATKISTRTRYAEVSGKAVELSLQEQSELLASYLTPEEIQYAQNVWK